MHSIAAFGYEVSNERICFMVFPCFYVLWNYQNNTGEIVEIVSYVKFLVNRTIRLHGYEVIEIYNIREEAEDKLASLKTFYKLLE